MIISALFFVLVSAGSVNSVSTVRESAPVVVIQDRGAEEIAALRRRAEQGQRIAQYNLAQAYWAGRGVPQNKTEAIRWFRLAADQGLKEAQFNLGVFYGRGDGVSRNDTEAARWIRLAADQGLKEAQVNLGLRYMSGEGVASNDVEAVRWFRLAADQGYAEGQSMLGAMYSDGRGVTQNDAEAVRLFRLAADQGHAMAQSFLGRFLLEGRGVAQNDNDAVAWLRRSAEQDNASAQNALGYAYMNGRGVPQSDEEALRWLRLSEAQGYAHATENIRVLREARAASPSAPEGQRIYDTPEQYARAQQNSGGAPASPAAQSGGDVNDDARCISVDTGGKGAAQLVNQCAYDLNVQACVVYEDGYANSRSFDCLTGRNGSWTLRAQSRQAALVRGGRVYLAVCSAPAYPANVRFERGRGLLAECR